MASIMWCRVTPTSKSGCAGFPSRMLSANRRRAWDYVEGAACGDLRRHRGEAFGGGELDQACVGFPGRLQAVVGVGHHARP